MAVQALDPATPPGGFPVQRPGEFHLITVRLEQDTTECQCTEPGCGFCEHAGTGTEPATVHGFDHAIATGHTVTERRVRLTVIRERA